MMNKTRATVGIIGNGFVGNGENYSVNQIADMISDNTINIPARPGESRITLANNNKIKDTFGWDSTIKVEDWIANNG